MTGFIRDWSTAVTSVVLAVTVVVLTARAMVLAPATRTVRALDAAGAVGLLLLLGLVAARFVVLS
jgi:hypothetical protein